MRDYTRKITHYLELEKEILAKLDTAAINSVINLLEETRERGASIYICGNGGSASTASHFTADFNKITQIGKRYRFICLNDNTAYMMAVANDFSYDEIFVHQLRSVISQNDVLICISGSGNSKNVLNAAVYAKEMGAAVVGITGYDGGRLYNLADYRLHVPIPNMQIAEDIHLIFDHMMVWILANSE